MVWVGQGQTFATRPMGMFPFSTFCICTTHCRAVTHNWDNGGVVVGKGEVGWGGRGGGSQVQVFARASVAGPPGSLDPPLYMSIVMNVVSYCL